jgi:hypothetical protein
LSNTNPTKTGCELKCSGRTSSLCCIRHGTLVTNPIISNELKDQLWLPQTEHITGADPGFQVRGGALKKIVPSRGRRQNFWGISCEKSYFSNFRGGCENFGVFHVKNHDFMPKKIIFLPILGGGAHRVHPPLNPPLY